MKAFACSVDNFIVVEAETEADAQNMALEILAEWVDRDVHGEENLVWVIEDEGVVDD